MTTRRPEPPAPSLIEAVAAERDRLASVLHDDVVQTLGAAGLRADLVRAVLGDAAVTEVTELQETLAEAIRELRGVMESLRRPMVEPAGLALALRRRFARPELEVTHPVTVIDDLVREPAEDLAIGLYWLAEEAVGALRRTRGNGAIAVALRSPAGAFELEVSATRTDAASDERPALDGVHRSAALIGGAVSLDEPRPGVTRILARAPEPRG